jgi:hypothetical protein
MEWMSFKRHDPPVGSTILVNDVRTGEYLRAKVTGLRSFTTEHCKVYSFDHSFFSHWWRIDDMVLPSISERLEWKLEQNIT